MTNRIDRYWSRVTEDRHSYEKRMRQDTNKYISRWLDELREEKKYLEAEIEENDGAVLSGLQWIFLLNLSLAAITGIFWFFSFVFGAEVSSTMLLCVFGYVLLNLVEFSLKENNMLGGVLGFLAMRGVLGFLAILCLGYCCYSQLADTMGFEHEVWRVVSACSLLLIFVERFCLALWTRDRKQSMAFAERKEGIRESIEWGTKRLVTNTRIDSLFEASNN